MPQRKQEMKREFHPRKRFHWDFQTRNKHEAHGKQKRRVICREDYTDAIESNEDTDVALPAVLLTAMQVQSQSRPEMRTNAFYENCDIRKYNTEILAVFRMEY